MAGVEGSSVLEAMDNSKACMTKVRKDRTGDGRRSPLDKLSDDFRKLRERERIPVSVVVSEGGHSTAVTKYMKSKLKS